MPPQEVRYEYLRPLLVIYHSGLSASHQLARARFRIPNKVSRTFQPVVHGQHQKQSSLKLQGLPPAEVSRYP